MSATGYRASLIASMVTFLTVDGIALAGRLYVRAKLQTRSFGLDDLVLVVGYVLHCAMGSTAMSYGYAAEEEKPYYDEAESKRYHYANQLCIYISSGLVKLAVALVLYRLAASKRIRLILLGSMLLVGIWTVVMTVYTSWLCAKQGSSNYAGSRTCKNVGHFRTISNIFIDYFYALLPVYMLWNVQMSIRLKITVCLLLGLGVFASSATIVKLVVITRLTNSSKEEEKGLHYDLLLWADIELGLAIFCASAAALRPLLRHIPGLWDSLRTPRSHKSHISDAVGGGPYRTINPDSEMDRLTPRVKPLSVEVENEHRESPELAH
ncbi:hypothetical protein DL766_009987 [Monosporascus sp. MC13-8B]|uniref:Rhodopsin domain-containing protein n=1 Tax=Monosporascus cannonballus TaxID=155416 RepID=A0ABY0HG11_9PEZI|nr:hypothetical protein DL762_002483 [Monosporascus cannonballus]RYO98935.1 hypothetical protein DL763_001845 [Monosporascus cannonballus]RYP12167.1 hypothetical protein DL766_009987 [Monosporascus sp. MC13-8B]